MVGVDTDHGTVPNELIKPNEAFFVCHIFFLFNFYS